MRPEVSNGKAKAEWRPTRANRKCVCICTPCAEVERRRQRVEKLSFRSNGILLFLKVLLH